MVAKKLRILPGTKITTVNAPKNYKDLLGDLPEEVSISSRLSGQHSFIQLFVHNKAELEQYLGKTVTALTPGGLLWITYPKGSSGMQTDLTRDKGWESLEALQMKSLVSFSDQWSAFLVTNTPPKKKATVKKDGSEQFIDAATKTVIVPEDLAKAFKQEKTAKALFDAYAYSHRKEYVVWITSAKRPETRATRVQKTIEMLLAGRKNPADK